MFTRRFVLPSMAFTAVLGSALLFAQTKPPASSASVTREFPVTMQQNVVAGQTAVGTKVEAKLTLATLVDGTVIPAGAIFSGEVIESGAKSATDPSRLAIRMDSVHWKKGSAPVKVYLTAWYYPIRMATEAGGADVPPLNKSVSAPLPNRRGGSGTYNPNPSTSQPSQGRPGDPQIPPAPASNISENRVAMKDIASTRQADGALTLTSTRFNIKLDKTTTYVLATGDLTAK